ncbi:hypothetical protein L227DRAFT_580514 [Lentinus tigrinus ALCF2SS1-6]|uniref:Uncharacterized protein n=1 Tax=Lentinus tigrinus ALCF2SS1-6 TaxID=1328759 RepID=A0A5C2RU83_9APHY|nr:hypothetical protein L227DRAFT_580514 [Lentinus tigrinus ALCF2SS1-6]
MHVLYSAPPRLDIQRVFLTICACLGLENYQPGESIISRSFGRFPMRSKFILDYIFQVAGHRNRSTYRRQPLLRPYHGVQLSPRPSIIFDLSPVVPRSSSALTACSQTSSYMDSLVYLLATSLSALSRNLVMCLL